MRLGFSLFLLFSSAMTSCQGQVEKASAQNDMTEIAWADPGLELLGPFNEKNPSDEPALEIRAWTYDILEDKAGNMWFGTKGWGVIRYDGDTVVYLSVKDGMGGDEVREITESENGDLWFATSGGLTQLSGGHFKTYGDSEGLADGDAHSLLIDSHGLLWIGTAQGVSTFDGTNFTYFDLPESEPDSVDFVRSGKMVHTIIEDREGNIWFGTNGGAHKYDGRTLTNLSEADGLCDNAVKSILEDSKGNMWFSTEHGKACFWDGTSFTAVKTDVDRYRSKSTSDLFQDSRGDIWIPVDNVAMHRYNGGATEKMFEPQGCISHTLRTTYEDSKGRLWFGGWNGVYRYDGH